MAKREKLRSVRASVKKTAKGTVKRIIKHLRSDEDPPRDINCSDTPCRPHPRTSIPADLFGPPTPQIAHINPTIQKDPDTHCKSSGSLTKDGTSTVRSNNENDSASGKLRPASSKELLDQFEELCSLVHRRLKEDTTKRRRMDSGYETDVDIAEDIRQYVPVRIKSFKSTERVKIERPSRPEIPAPPAQENVRPPLVVQQGLAIRPQIPPTPSPDHSLKPGERSESEDSTEPACESLKGKERMGSHAEIPANDSKGVNDWVLELQEAVKVAELKPHCVIVGIDPDENNDLKDPKDVAVQGPLEEGFTKFLTEVASPLSGPASLVRTYGTDFYEYPRVPATPPPCYGLGTSESLKATCALYDGSYSVSSAGTTAIGMDLPQWTSYRNRRLLSSSLEAEPSRTPKVAKSIRSETLRDSEKADVRDRSDHSELADVASKEGALWETSPGKLLCFREGSIVTVEEVLRGLDE